MALKRLTSSIRFPSYGNIRILTTGRPMVWTTIPGVTGKVYVPDDTGPMQKKHPCKACFSCQWCDETRCQVCRNDQSATISPQSTPCCACGCRSSSDRQRRRSRTPGVRLDRVLEMALRALPVERGLKVDPYVKTSLAPGSRVVITSCSRVRNRSASIWI